LQFQALKLDTIQGGPEKILLETIDSTIDSLLSIVIYVNHPVFQFSSAAQNAVLTTKT